MKEAVAIASSVVAFFLSFAARRSSAPDPGLASALGVAQLRACGILDMDPLPMEQTTAVDTMATDGTTILYNAGFLHRALASICQLPECVDGLLLAMVAHELGHASGHHLELDADEIAGYVLGRAGLEPHHFLKILETFRSTGVHPPAGRRQIAVRRGYSRGCGERALK